MNSITPVATPQLAGVAKVFFVDHRQVLAVPPQVNGSYAQAVVLRPPAKWAVLVSTTYTPALDAEGTPSQHGTTYKQEIEGFFAGDTPEVNQKFAAMNGRRYLVLLQYYNGTTVLVGDKVGGLQFTYKFKSGTRPREKKGYSWKFEGVTRSPATYTTAPFVVEDVGPITPSSAFGATVTVKDGLGNILAEAPPGTTVIVNIPTGGGDGGGDGGTSDDVTFNWDREITANIPGLLGRVIGGQSLVTGLARALFVIRPPRASISVAPKNFDYRPLVDENGDNTTVLVTETWSATKTDLALDEIVLDGVMIANPTGGSKSGQRVIAVEAQQPQTVSLAVLDNDGNPAYASDSIAWWLRRFAFTTADDFFLALDNGSEDVSGDIRNLTAGEWANTRQQNLQLGFEPGSDAEQGQYGYWLWPQAFGLPAKITANGLGYSDYGVRVMTFETLTGYKGPHYLIRTGGRLRKVYSWSIT